jgi:hypothetical protein
MIVDAPVLTPGTPDHFRDRLVTTAGAVLELAQGRLDTDQDVGELIEVIELLDDDARALGQALALERRRRFRIVQ